MAVAEAANGNGLFDRISRSNRRESMLALRAFVGVDLRRNPSVRAAAAGLVMAALCRLAGLEPSAARGVGVTATLYPCLADGATVVLDDGRRRAETRAAFAWHAGYADLELTWHDTGRGA